MPVDRFFEKLDSFESILYKTLSNNDYKWAVEHNIHQSGVLIPKELAEFFPPVDYSNPLFVTDIQTYWIEDGNWQNILSKWHYYESKTEWRVTTVPKAPFKDIDPGSLLLIGKTKTDDYYFFIVNSANEDEYDYAIEKLEIREAPKWGIVIKEHEALVEKDPELDKLLQLPEDITEIPNILELSELAERIYKQINGSKYDSALNTNPGDLLDDINKLEYKIYKKYETILYSNILAEKSQPDIYSIGNINENKNFYRNRVEDFTSVFISMTQSRKSRVGKSFEYHFKNYLTYKDIPFSYQQKVDGKKKPDFIIPSKDYYYNTERKPDDAILLSLKTTLRERWQQILNEGNQVKTKYLLTLDKTVTSDQITEMAEKDVILIVTEWAKRNTDSYKEASNVFSLKKFSENIDRFKS